ncbi:hypothetical protein SAMN05421736_10787 [Evansella caseinilytica]|uniref:YtkA-like domain-containing protein n=1 Tax=Evansella caseinilytica TaxID=1503961 RepID=A0A1H3QYS9_9BACI|nr:hypothetical protein [Evansella caseinilytica]SDZ17859.1 hypothetical protein SAMN05421736_10787 [Evansella caseinilytica]
MPEVKQKKILNAGIYYAGLAFIAALLWYAIWLHDASTNLKYSNDWTIQLAAKQYPLIYNRPVIMHVVALDGHGEWINGAEVKMTFPAVDESREKEWKFRHIEDGLYEAIIHFPSPGQWEGLLDVTKGKTGYMRQIQLTVGER